VNRSPRRCTRRTLVAGETDGTSAASPSRFSIRWKRHLRPWTESRHKVAVGTAGACWQKGYAVPRRHGIHRGGGRWQSASIRGAEYKIIVLREHPAFADDYKAKIGSMDQFALSRFAVRSTSESEITAMFRFQFLWPSANARMKC